MNVGGGEAADQMVRMMLSCGEVAVRLSGSAIKNMLAMSMALAKNRRTLSGRVQMGKMLRETRDLRVFPMSAEKYRQFQKLAGRQKLLYSAIRDQDGRTKLVDVVLPVTELDRANVIFQRMATITTETDETDAGTVLYLTVEAETADNMRELYGFTDDQNAALDELLAETELLDGLITDLSVSQADAAALVEALPEDLDPARRAVVEAACSLVGKVNYWWGGKSLVLGWDDRWGSLRKVTAEGSPTSRTYRPYGLDCSGMVDWVFYNATGGEYVIGHGGGAAAQHSYCTPILWSEAQPGDLVFYPEDVHVGIVGGRDEDGRLLIIHCASGYNNTVITELEGFTAIARPVYYGQ